MNCKQCNKIKTSSNDFCSKECRNLWVSEFMIKKSKQDKKKFGNTYYLKKSPDEKIKK